MIHTAVTSTADGSVVIPVDMNVSDAEKKLAKLKGSIEKTEKKISDMTKEKEKAEQKGLFQGAEIEAEHRKLQEIKDRLEEIRKLSKDKTISFDRREDYAAQIPIVKQDLADQQTRVRALEAEWKKTENAVDSYNLKIASANEELTTQKIAAGELVQQIEEAENAAGKMGGGLDSVGKRLDSILEKLLAQHAISVEVNKALGDVVNTQTKLTGLAEEFSLSAKIGLVGIAQAAVKVASLIASGVPGAFKIASSAVSEFAKSAIAKIPALMQNAFSRAAKFGGAFGKKLIDVTKNMNVFSKLSDGLSQKLKRLGQMIKRVFVFSVITSGLRAIRTQMSGYLQVNTEFMTALRRLQGVLLTAFQPIYDAVLPALTALINGMSQAVALVSQFTARLFGTTAKQSQKSAEALYNEAKALEATGSAAEDAAGSLAGFDEINSIQTENKSSSGGAAAESGPLFDYEYEDQPFDSWGEALNGFLDQLLIGIPKMRETLLDFADWLNGFTKKLYDMFTFPGVLDKVKQLGQDLASVLNDAVNRINWYQLGQALGAGMNLALQFLTNFIYTFDWINLGMSLAAMVNGAVSEIDWYAVGQLLWAGSKIAIETLAGFLIGLDMAALAKAANRIVQGFFDEMVNTIEKIQWNRIGEQIALFLNNIDWYNLITSVANALGAALIAFIVMVQEFVKTLKWHEIAEQIYTAINDAIGNEALFENLGITLSDLVIHIFDFIRETIAGIDWFQIGSDIAAFLEGIDWDGVADSLFGALGTAFAGLGLFIVGLFSDAVEAVKEHFDTWIAIAEEGGGSIVDGILMGIGSGLVNIVQWIKEHVFDPFIDGFCELFGIHSPSTVMAELGGYIMEGLFNGIDDAIAPVVELFESIFNNFIAFVEGVFTGDWKKAWEGISGIFKDVWNGIVGTLESAINFVIRGINSLIAQLNKVSFDIPDWVPSIGGKTFGFNIPSISEVQIPRLAQGAVIPPNREFMAVLGDQKSGNNLEAPEDLIRKIVREESGGGNAELVQLLQSILAAIKAGQVIMVGETVLGRTTIKAINNVTTAAGKQLLLI